MKKSLLAVGMFALATGAMSQNVLVSEDFDALTSLPPNWTQTTASTDGGWLTGTAASLSSQNWAVGGSNTSGMLVTNDDGCNCDKSDDLLMSAPIDLSTVSSAHLSVDVFFNGGTYQGNSETGTIEVTTNGGTTWTVLATLTGNAEWSSAVYDLTPYVGNANVMIGFRYSDGTGWLFGMGIDNFSVYEPVDRDLTVTSVDVPAYIDINVNSGTVSIMGGIVNMGAATVTSFDLHYKIGATGTPVTDSKTVNINSLGDYSFTHATDWTPAMVGDATIEVWADNINGMADQNTANDANSTSTLVYDQSVPRIPLVESFTSSTCGPCVAGNQNMSGIFSAAPAKQNIIKYQMSWPGAGDPYYTAEGGDRRTYYGVNSVPNVWVDAGLGINSQSLTAANIDNAVAVPSFVEIVATHVSSTDFKTWTLDVTLNPLVDFPGTNVLMAAIYEHETFKNIGSNGETEFDFVMKKMMPDANGTSVGALTAGTPYTTTLSYTFNGDYILPANASTPVNHASEHSVEDFKDLGIVVWVENQTNNTIFQSGISKWVDENGDPFTGLDENGNPIGIEENINGSVLSMFPNPANTSSTLWYSVEDQAQVSVDVYNAIGELVQSERMGNQTAGEYNTEINTESLSEGIYFVKLNIGDQTLVEKLMVNK